MNAIKISSLLFLVFGFWSCQSSETNDLPVLQVKSGDSVQASNSNKPDKKSARMIVVKDVIQVEKYTYLNVADEGADKWMAVPTVEAKKGDTLYYQSGMLMTNFESKELKRTFNEILFVDKVSRDPSIAMLSKEVIMAHQNLQLGDKSADKTSEKPYPNMGSSKDTVKRDIKVEKLRDAVTIATLLKDLKKYEGKKVVVHGKVTKYTPEVMGKNWVHIQDGSEFKGKFEIVITTMDKVSKDETVTFEGTITLNKDFGYGYFFELLMENGSLKK